MIQPKAPSILARAAFAKRLGEGMGEVRRETAKVLDRSSMTDGACSARIIVLRPATAV
jgi:hypothetical protein